MDNILDINFLHNIVGYVVDCEKAGLKLSFFQLLLFYDDASSLLTPPFLNWVPLWLLTWLHHMLAFWIAKGLLGYIDHPPYIS